MMQRNDSSCRRHLCLVLFLLPWMVQGWAPTSLTRFPSTKSRQRWIGKSSVADPNFVRRRMFISPTYPSVSASSFALALSSETNQVPEDLLSLEEKDWIRTVRNNLIKVSLLTTVAWMVWKWAAILSFLQYVKNEWLLTTLERLNSSGPAGLALYFGVFFLWTIVAGITTPVETAAGMAFGVGPGILASGLAKFLAALATFGLARYQWAHRIRPMVEKNEVLSLMEDSIHERPFQVALLCRFSPLPELLKNSGMGVSSVPLRWFLASLVVHGMSFTCLWTWMGAETARVIQGFPPSATLKVLLTGATWIGFAAPVCIGWWLKSLKDKQQEKHRLLEKSNEASS